MAARVGVRRFGLFPRFRGMGRTCLKPHAVGGGAWPRGHGPGFVSSRRAALALYMLFSPPCYHAIRGGRSSMGGQGARAAFDWPVNQICGTPPEKHIFIRRPARAMASLEPAPDAKRTKLDVNQFIEEVRPPPPITIHHHPSPPITTIHHP